MILTKTNGIPLLRRPLKEHHQIITIFTERNGLVHAVGFGISHFGSKRSGAVDLLNFCELELKSHKGMWDLHSAHATKCFITAKNDLESSMLGFDIVVFLAQYLPLDMPQPKVFRLLVKLLELLDTRNFTTNEIAALSILFKSKTLFLLGFFPRLKERSWQVIEKGTLEEALKHVSKAYYKGLQDVIDKVGEPLYSR
jgi:DNA repair protein RecO